MDYLKFETSDIMYDNPDMSYAEALELGRVRIPRELCPVYRVTHEEYEEEIYGL
jgi:hypothetical protein